MAAYIDQTVDLTQAAWEHICHQPGFEVPCQPESNILCFRYQGSDALQLAIRDQLIAQGNFHISSTKINDRRYLRIVCISPATTLADIQELIAAIPGTANQTK
jgi:L-2,4-diaminobutyrate decarboxylase